MPRPTQRARAPLTRAEVEQRSAEAFARMDANDDGVLNQADREARGGSSSGSTGSTPTTTASSTRPTARRASKQAFDRIDADHSGGISFEEFTALREQRQERRAERRGPKVAPACAGRRRPRRLRGGRGMARAADTDRDGTVTQAEFASAALARFDRVDADKDGTISADERPAPRR